ncbi:MAG: histidine phosphatase family protein [Burkholderiaceae bacterium]
MLPVKDAARRRVYLMRHGSVTYFDEASGKIADSEQVPLNAQGRDQASAAGYAFKKAGIRFDRVIVSGLRRTVETAQRVLAQTGQQIDLQQIEALQEIRGGKLSSIPAHELRDAFLGAIDGLPQESMRFLGGESVGELLDRVLPQIDKLRADPHWDTVLLVLHGGVNRAILSYLATGQRMFIGGLAQAPACINALDVGDARHDVVVRMINHAPTSPLHTHTRKTTMEQLYEQFVKVQALLSSRQK